ncbi:oligosaccharide flippase family protein [Ekhidna sp.]|uniref:lipopolysaccharide biosynthesis protein n=1 Tax=Ekhidna sp. TaxID=2608089 RepID=UPI00329A473A
MIITGSILVSQAISKRLKKIRNLVLRKIIESKTTLFILLRYVSFGLKLVNAFLFAKYLGPYHFGIYSLYVLIGQYFNYGSLGTNYSYTAYMSDKSESDDLKDNLWPNTITLNITSSLLLIAGAVAYVIFFEANTQLLLLTALIASMVNINTLFVNLFRIYGKLLLINLNDILIPFSYLLLIILLKEKLQVETIFWLQLTLVGILMIFFISFSPEKLKIQYRIKIQKLLLSRGLKLFIYYVGFQLILISSRTVVSFYYSEEDLGFYTLANSLSKSLNQLSSILIFLFFPKIIEIISLKKNDSERIDFVREARNIFCSGFYLMIFIACFGLPFILNWIPEYKSISRPFILLIAAQAIFAIGFGYTMFLIWKRQEKSLIISVISALVFNITLSFIIALTNQEYIFITLSVLISSIVYVMQIIYYSTRLLPERRPLSWVTKEIPLGLIIPILLLVLGIIFEYIFISQILGLGTFLIMNFKRLKDVVRKVFSVLTSKNLFIK